MVDFSSPDSASRDILLTKMLLEYHENGGTFVPHDEYTLSEEDAQDLKNLLHAWREGSVMIMSSPPPPEAVNARSDEFDPEWHVDRDVDNECWRVVCDGTIVGTIKNVSYDQIEDLRRKLP